MPTPEPEKQFHYDASKPLTQKRVGETKRDGVSLTDMVFTTPANETMNAYWVMPSGKGPFPAVIYVHPAPGTRETFLEEAIALAQQGIAALLLEAPWSKVDTWIPQVSELNRNRELFTKIVIDLRRAVDWVIEQPHIAATYIGYVGHSFGALLGGILSGVEKRIRAFVLMAGSGSFTDVMTANMPNLQGSALATYRASVEPIDPNGFVRHAGHAAVFYQIARNDEVFPPENANAFAHAGSSPKRIQEYDTDHYFTNESAARQDRIAWLREQLQVKQEEQTNEQ